jgi:hypothetical protein
MQMTWRENLFVTTTTTTQFGRGRPAGGVERFMDSGDGMNDEEC